MVIQEKVYIILYLCTRNRLFMDKLPYREFLAMMGERTREADVPYSGSFELTPLCNFDCKMCYVHLQDPSVRQRMLSGEQWLTIIRQAIDAGMMEACLTGGEAMTHSAFWDIYMYLINHGIVTQVKTNGLLLNEDVISRFKDYPPYKLDISLYGCDSESVFYNPQGREQSQSDQG